jgi:hypothetical protein
MAFAGMTSWLTLGCRRYFLFVPVPVPVPEIVPETAPVPVLVAVVFVAGCCRCFPLVSAADSSLRYNASMLAVLVSARGNGRSADCPLYSAMARCSF